MRICSRCVVLRHDNSFYADDARYPNDVCKGCIHRSRPTPVQRLRGARHQRERQAVLDLVEQIQAERQSLVYLVRSGHFSKIGFSRNVPQRVRQLATASSMPVRLVAVVPGGRQLEQTLHTEFASLRQHLEWFRDKKQQIVSRFAQLPGAMVFEQGYLSPEAPAA